MFLPKLIYSNFSSNKNSKYRNNSLISKNSSYIQTNTNILISIPRESHKPKYIKNEDTDDEVIDDEDIDNKDIDHENIDDKDINDMDLNDEDIKDYHIYDEDSYDKNIDNEDIDDEDIDDEDIDDKDIDLENFDDDVIFWRPKSFSRDIPYTFNLSPINGISK